MRGKEVSEVGKGYIPVMINQWRVDIFVPRCWNVEKTPRVDADQLSRLRRGRVFLSSRWWSGDAPRQQQEHLANVLRGVLGAGGRLLPDVCLVCVPVLFRYFGDTGDSDGCWWPHVRQQRPAGLQYPARTAILRCGTSNRWKYWLHAGAELVQQHLFFCGGTAS